MELIVKVTTMTAQKREHKEANESSEKEIRYIVPEDFPDTESAKNMRMEFTSMICSLFGPREEDGLSLD